LPTLQCMTAPAHLCYTIYQGATFRRGFQWCTAPYPTRIVNGELVNAQTGKPVPPSDLTPVDLTGCMARMQLRADVLAPDVLLELTTQNGRIDLSGGGGRIAFILDAATTADLPYGQNPPAAWCTAVGQLEILHPNGDVSRVAEISWNLNPEGTR